MESIFEKLWRLGPAAFVLKAIVVVIVADGLLLGFILLRRTYRKWYFAKRDAHVFELRQNWDRLISGEIPYETWRQNSFDRRIVETIALDALEAAGAEESARLLKFLRESGLIQCCAERPQLLIPYVQHAAGPLREVLGRVLGEVATPSLSLDLLQFVGDDLDELRAAAARAMSHAERALAFDVLSELVGDPVWFVRLRAIISLGELCEPRAIPDLMRGLTDSNRLVRLRAAEALVKLKTEMAPIFQQVIATQDRYGLQAYLTALENAGLRGQLEEELLACTAGNNDEKTRLWKILQTGVLLAEETVLADSGPAKSAFLS